MRVLNTILLIDDDETTNYLNKRLLNKMAVARQIQVATNGEEAINYLKRHCPPSADAASGCPDLIFLDIKMPVMDGFEFLDEYRLLAPQFSQPAIIAMLSSSGSQLDLDRLQQYGHVNIILNKPLTEDNVRDLLAQFFTD